MKKIVIIGSGGHSKVILDLIFQTNLISKNRLEIVGILDDCYTENMKIQICEIPVIGKIDLINQLPQNLYYIIGIGNNIIRKKISQNYKKINFLTLIHPNATIGSNVKISEGSVVMAGVVINSNTTIGKHCIINTNSVIEHDNKIGDFVHISPGTIICGNVQVNNKTWIGANSTIIQGLKIGKNVVVAAGSVVINNILNDSVVAGIPAKLKKLNIKNIG